MSPWIGVNITKLSDGTSTSVKTSRASRRAMNDVNDVTPGTALNRLFTRDGCYGADGGRIAAAGQGLEPQLPEPESGVLPITPPGKKRRPV